MFTNTGGTSPITSVKSNAESFDVSGLSIRNCSTVEFNAFFINSSNTNRTNEGLHNTSIPTFEFVDNLMLGLQVK